MLNVPSFPPLIDEVDADYLRNPQGGPGAVRAALPVVGSGQWEAWGEAALWGLAQNGPLILSGPSAGISTGTFNGWIFYTWPHYQAVARLWCISLLHSATDIDDCHASGVVQVDSVEIGKWKLGPTDFGSTKCFRFVQQLSAQTDTPASVLLTISNAISSGGAGVYNMGINCYELPRATLDAFGPNPSSYGAVRVKPPDPSGLQTGAIMVGGGDENSVSLGGLGHVVFDPTQLRAETRRSCLFSHCRPSSWQPDTSFESLFAKDPEVLARPRYAGESVVPIKVAAYGRGPSGSSVRVTASSGDTLSLALPTSNGWVVGEIDVEPERHQNWETDGGLPSAGSETLLVEGRRVGGSHGDCRVYAVCAAEAI